MRRVPTPAEVKTAAAALHSLILAVQHLRECQTENEPALCGHVHEVGQAARNAMPIMQTLAEAGHPVVVE